MTNPNNRTENDSQIKTLESNLTIENTLFKELSSKFSEKIQLIYVTPEESKFTWNQKIL
jgi:hypothetical protein